MPETFLDSFIRTTRDDELQKLIVANMDGFKKVLTLYDEWSAMTRFFDEEDMLYDPPGCFQC